MKVEKTICWKIEQTLDELKKGNKLEVASLLYEIKRDALNMETGLRERKKMMIEAEIEEKYQGKTVVDDRMSEAGIGKPVFNVTITKDNKTLFQKDTYAGVVSLTTKFEGIDKDGLSFGTAARYIFGHPVGTLFAFDQLKQYMGSYQVEMIKTLKDYFINHKNLIADNGQGIIAAINKINS